MFCIRAIGDLYFWEITAATGLDWSHLALQLLCGKGNEIHVSKLACNGSRLDLLEYKPFFRAVYTFGDKLAGLSPALSEEYLGVPHIWHQCTRTHFASDAIPQRRLAIVHVTPRSDSELQAIVKAFENRALFAELAHS